MFLVRHLEQRDGTGHADRQSRGDGLAKRQRLAVGAEEHGGRRPRRCGLAAVVDGDRVARAVVIEEEPAAADARSLRLGHAQHHLHGNGGIDGRAATAEDFETGLDRERMSGGHHLLRLGVRASDAADQQREGENGAEAPHARRATMNMRRNGKSVMPSARVG